MSVIKIGVQRPEIDFEIGEKFNYTYIYTDESMRKIEEGRTKILEKVQGYEATDDDLSSMDDLKELLTEGFDLLFGEGTFDELYEEYGSSITLGNVFVDTYLAVENEIEERGLDTSKKLKSEKYKRNNRNKNKSK